MLSALSESRGELLRFGLAFAAACPRATVCLWNQTDLPLRRAARSARGHSRAREHGLHRGWLRCADSHTPEVLLGLSAGWVGAGGPIAEGPSSTEPSGCLGCGSVDAPSVLELPPCTVMY